jgi:hypothetical protein
MKVLTIFLVEKFKSYSFFYILKAWLEVYKTMANSLYVEKTYCCTRTKFHDCTICRCF